MATKSIQIEEQLLNKFYKIKEKHGFHNMSEVVEYLLTKEQEVKTLEDRVVKLEETSSSLEKRIYKLEHTF